MGMQDFLFFTLQELAFVLKSAITSLMDFAKPIVNDILRIILLIYKLCPQNTVLIVAKTVSVILCY